VASSSDRRGTGIERTRATVRDVSYDQPTPRGAVKAAAKVGVPVYFYNHGASTITELRFSLWCCHPARQGTCRVARRPLLDSWLAATPTPSPRLTSSCASSTPSASAQAWVAPMSTSVSSGFRRIERGERHGLVVIAGTVVRGRRLAGGQLALPPCVHLWLWSTRNSARTPVRQAPALQS